MYKRLIVLMSILGVCRNVRVLWLLNGYRVISSFLSCVCHSGVVLFHPVATNIMATTRVERTMSVSSKMAVDTVERLRERLEGLEDRVRKTDEVTSSPKSTVEVRTGIVSACTIET